MGKATKKRKEVMVHGYLYPLKGIIKNRKEGEGYEGKSLRENMSTSRINSS